MHNLSFEQGCILGEVVLPDTQKKITNPSLRYLPQLYDFVEVIVRHDGIVTDFMFSHSGLPIVSEDLCNIFHNNEVIATPVKFINNKINKKFVAISTLNSIDCVDENNSEFDVWEKNNSIRPDKAGEYKSFYKLIIDPTKCNGYNIFRVQGFSPALIVNGIIFKDLSGFDIRDISITNVSLN